MSDLRFTTYSRDCIDGECEDCDLAECQCDCHEEPPVPTPFDPYDRSWGY